MERLALRRQGRLKAATLLESILAMGLMAASLAFAVGLHSRILLSDHAPERIQAWALTEEVLERQRARAGTVMEGTSQQGPFTVVVTEKPYASGLSRLSIACSLGTHRILERQCLIPAKR